MAKFKELDGANWAKILNQICESNVDTPTKLIICHGLVTILEVERR